MAPAASGWGAGARNHPRLLGIIVRRAEYAGSDHVIDRRLAHVAIDLTHLARDGVQGGARPVALALVRAFAQSAPELDVTLLTNQATDAELAYLDGPRLRRLLARREPDPERLPARMRSTLRSRVVSALPVGATLPLRRLYWSAWTGRRQRRLARAAHPDVVFSPLTTATPTDRATPLVAMVHDLQHVAYPAFFTRDQVALRQQALEELGQRAARLVCVSEHARQSLLAAADVDPARVVVIHHTLFDAPATPSTEETAATLQDLGAETGRFLLYPANFWPHKNHRALLRAMALYQRRRPAARLVLICTGSPSERTAELRALADDLGIGDLVRFPGYLPRRRLSALWLNCRALVFPSLFEGFGLPLLEAMACATPIVCSRVTSLPEVAGDAALYFDPLAPEEIAVAIEQIDTDADLRARLVGAGSRRLNTFGTVRDVAQRYLRVLADAAHAEPTATAAPAALSAPGPSQR